MRLSVRKHYVKQTLFPSDIIYQTKPSAVNLTPIKRPVDSGFVVYSVVYLSGVPPVFADL